MRWYDITCMYKTKLRLNSLIFVLGLNLFRIDTHFLPHRSEWTFYSNEIQCLHLHTFSVNLFFSSSPSLTIYQHVCFSCSGFNSESSPLNSVCLCTLLVVFYFMTNWFCWLFCKPTSWMDLINSVSIHTCHCKYSSQHRFNFIWINNTVLYCKGIRKNKHFPLPYFIVTTRKTKFSNSSYNLIKQCF